MDKMEWTAQQIAAFVWFATLGAIRSLVVRARAGCGKTTLIVEGVKRYVAACVAANKPVRVLATSFTRKSVSALMEKLKGMAGVDVRSLNSLGFKYVMDYARANRMRIKLDDTTARRRKFDLARRVEPSASDSVITMLAKLNETARKLMPLATCGADLMPLLQQFDLGVDEDAIKDGWTDEGLCDAAYDCMCLASKWYTEIDFADQIFLPIRNRWIRPLFDRVIVDETQDMDKAQLLLVQGACFDPTKGFCVVGDDQQAIFGFRGADVTAIDRLKTELEADECPLTVTWRCGTAIVDYAKQANPAVADYMAGEGAHTGEVTTKHDVASMLVAVKPGDFILSRTNAPLVKLCLALLARGVRAYVAGRDIGTTLITIVRKLKINNIDQLATALQSYTDAKIAKLSKDPKASDKEWLDAKIEGASDESEAILAVADGCHTIPELIGKLEGLFSDEASRPSVMLSTIHKAKGLEADNVYFAIGTLKIRSHDDEMLHYVAATRAKHALHLVSGFETGSIESALAA
jgi:superfamily I DNA/RNA helicase